MKNFIFTEIDTALQSYKGFFHTEKEVQNIGICITQYLIITTNTKIFFQNNN